MFSRSICRIKPTSSTASSILSLTLKNTTQNNNNTCRTFSLRSSCRNSSRPLHSRSSEGILRPASHILEGSNASTFHPVKLNFSYRLYSSEEKKPLSNASVPTSSSAGPSSHIPSTSEPPQSATIRENIYTIPNYITVSRILSCPILGWSIVTGNFPLATGLVVYAGFTDWLDGYLARSYNMSSVMGTILDPAADKALMTTLTVALAMKGLLPLPLAVIILGRDVLLSFSAFYYRYISLPPPKTFTRYWDFSIPSAEVRPTTISKVNTALQLLLMTTTVFDQVIPYDLGLSLEALQWIVGGTTIWSGMSYVFSKNAVRILSTSKRLPPPPPPPSTP